MEDGGGGGGWGGNCGNEAWGMKEVMRGVGMWGSGGGGVDS